MAWMPSCASRGLGADGVCAEDADCAGDETCLFDLTRGTSYCTRRCARDADCPREASCRFGSDRLESGATELGVCVLRVRTCSAEGGGRAAELCNGLDDDCDGVADGAGCTPITRCLDDAPCGAFVCRAPENQPDALCAPRNEGARVADFAPCSAGDDCENGLCETGLCSPLCGGDGDACPGDLGLFCARAVGPRARPTHNACQKPCETSRDCVAPQSCVWREVYQARSGPNHAFVCSIPGPERAPIGSPCSSNALAGDDECAEGLCFGRVCTRSCEGPGSSCGDVGAGFTCRRQSLFYGDQEFIGFLCVREG